MHSRLLPHQTVVGMKHQVELKGLRHLVLHHTDQALRHLVLHQVRGYGKQHQVIPHQGMLHLEPLHQVRKCNQTLQTELSNRKTGIEIFQGREVDFGQGKLQF